MKRNRILPMREAVARQWMLRKQRTESETREVKSPVEFVSAYAGSQGVGRGREQRKARVFMC